MRQRFYKRLHGFSGICAANNPPPLSPGPAACIVVMPATSVAELIQHLAVSCIANGYWLLVLCDKHFPDNIQDFHTLLNLIQPNPNKPSCPGPADSPVDVFAVSDLRFASHTSKRKATRFQVAIREPRLLQTQISNTFYEFIQSFQNTPQWLFAANPTCTHNIDGGLITDFNERPLPKPCPACPAARVAPDLGRALPRPPG